MSSSAPVPAPPEVAAKASTLPRNGPTQGVNAVPKTTPSSSGAAQDERLGEPRPGAVGRQRQPGEQPQARLQQQQHGEDQHQHAPAPLDGTTGLADRRAGAAREGPEGHEDRAEADDVQQRAADERRRRDPDRTPT